MDRIMIGYPAGYLRFFWIKIGFGYLFLKKIGSGQNQDICLISITKFPWKWFMMSQMIVVVFCLLWCLYSRKTQNYFCQYVMHSSRSMIIRFTSSLFFSGEVKVVSLCYIAGVLLCCVEWHMCVVQASGSQPFYSSGPVNST